MAYRSSSTGSGNGFQPATAVPAGAASGDIMILAATIDASAAVFDTGDWPTGFTELSEVGMTLDGQRAAIGWKRLSGADSGSYTFGDVGSIGDWIAQAYAFSGRHATDPPTLTTATSNASNASPVSVNASTITAVSGDDLLWVSAPDVNASGIATGHTAPTDYAERQDVENAWSNLAGASRDNVSAGATGTVTGTLTLASGASGWTAWLVRIPSDSAPPSIPPILVMAPMRPAGRR